MFWKKKQETMLNSKEFEELFALMNRLRLDHETLKLELQLYIKKLRASKGVKDFQEKEENPKDLYNSVLLPE